MARRSYALVLFRISYMAVFPMTSTAKRHDLDPFAWLRDVLSKRPMLAVEAQIGEGQAQFAKGRIGLPEALIAAEI